MLFEVKNVEYTISNLSILNKQSLSLKDQDNLLIIGPSGCGKTTLINLMAGLLKPTAGEIIFQKKKLSSITESEVDAIRAKNFGFIFQKLCLIGHLTAEQNIKLAQNESTKIDIQDLIHRLGLTKKKKVLVNNLSHGEAQRVAIARGMANNPKIIFADEPTSSLDDLNAKKVIDLIFKISKKNSASLIVSTHDSRMKKYFSNILKMK